MFFIPCAALPNSRVVSMKSNKTRSVEQRGKSMRKVDRMLFSLRHEVRPKEKGGQAPAEKVDIAAAEEKKPVPVAAPIKKKESKTLDAAATNELMNQLRQKLKVPADRALTWSYLEYACTYNGIRLNDHQRKALRHALTEGAAAQQAQK